MFFHTFGKLENSNFYLKSAPLYIFYLKNLLKKQKVDFYITQLLLPHFSLLFVYTTHFFPLFPSHFWKWTVSLSFIRFFSMNVCYRIDVMEWIAKKNYVFNLRIVLAWAKLLDQWNQLFARRNEFAEDNQNSSDRLCVARHVAQGRSSTFLLCCRIFFFVDFFFYFLFGKTFAFPLIEHWFSFYFLIIDRTVLKPHFPCIRNWNTAANKVLF